MAIKDENLKEFLDKVKKMEKGEKLDLSSDEDLSIAIMNLISIEEHLFFTSQKTGKIEYLDVLHQTREMRKNLLKLIVRDYEGEVWCISKHLLSASMRLMEVGTKALTKGDKTKANDFFVKAYDLYNLFWGLNLGLVKKTDIAASAPALPSKTGKTAFNSSLSSEGDPLPKSDMMGKISGVIGKILDCCRE